MFYMHHHCAMVVMMGGGYKYIHKLNEGVFFYRH